MEEIFNGSFAAGERCRLPDLMDVFAWTDDFIHPSIHYLYPFSPIQGHRDLLEPIPALLMISGVDIPETDCPLSIIHIHLVLYRVTSGSEIKNCKSWDCDFLEFPPFSQSRSYCYCFEAWMTFGGLTEKWDVWDLKFFTQCFFDVHPGVVWLTGVSPFVDVLELVWESNGGNVGPLSLPEI